MIHANQVSKFYKLGAHGSPGAKMLRDVIQDVVAQPFRWALGLRRKNANVQAAVDTSSLWALKDVTFDISRGAAVGIIGHNGAGKSTLLKILSRITSPTSGQIDIRGRVGSLLEVGTGFHPELTGRENIFLNGAIIGMGKREIEHKFDRIVEFSEVGRFIDTPVKRYSSGMYVRLAFAVAAHMEPDILLIDEVLSVGDLAFQRKCMEHAKRLRSRGVTLLFVSHNMFSIKAMCERVIYLSRGSVLLDGPTEKVTAAYNHDAQLQTAAWAQNKLGSNSKNCRIHVTKIEVLDAAGYERGLFDHGERMRIRLHYEARGTSHPNFTVAILRADGTACCNYSSGLDGASPEYVEGRGVAEFVTPPIKLVADLYSLEVLIWDRTFEELFCAQSGPSFHVRHPLMNTDFGVFHEEAQWRISGARGSTEVACAEACGTTGQ